MLQFIIISPLIHKENPLCIEQTWQGFFISYRHIKDSFKKNVLFCRFVCDTYTSDDIHTLIYSNTHPFCRTILLPIHENIYTLVAASLLLSRWFCWWLQRKKWVLAFTIQPGIYTQTSHTCCTLILKALEMLNAKNHKW